MRNIRWFDSTTMKRAFFSIQRADISSLFSLRCNGFPNKISLSSPIYTVSHKFHFKPQTPRFRDIRVWISLMYCQQDFLLSFNSPYTRVLLVWLLRYLATQRSLWSDVDVIDGLITPCGKYDRRIIIIFKIRLENNSLDVVDRTSKQIKSMCDRSGRKILDTLL